MALTLIPPSGIDPSGNYTVNGITVSANASIANLTVTTTSNLGAVGNIYISGGTANYVLQTDGAGTLTWVAQSGGGGGNTSNIANGTSNVSIATSGGNVTTSVAGNANILIVTGTGVNVAGTLNTTGNLTAGNISASGSGGNITNANVVSANLFIGSGANLTSLAGANVTGTVPLATTAGTVTTAAQPNITSTGTLTSLAVTGNITSGNANLGNSVTANFFTGNGYLLTGVGNATAIVNGNSNVSIPSANGNVNISAVGNANIIVVTGTGVNVAGTLNTTGNLTAGNISASGSGGNITNANVISANLFVGSGANLTSLAGANVTGTVPLATTAGTVTTAAQPNITSTGTLTSLAVSGTANIVGNLIGGSELNVSGNGLFGGNLTVNGTLTYINSTTLSISDPIINLQTGPNGAAPVANTGKDVGTALNYYDTSAKIAWMGWDISNAEIAFGSNVGISSEVVTFTSLANIRSGNANLGNLVTANFFTGNGYLLTGVGNATAIVNGNSNVNIPSANGNVNISAAGNANIIVVTGTGVNVAGTLNTTGNTTFTGANVNLGAVANLHISGGTTGYVLSTDGSGALSWISAAVAASGSNIVVDTFSGNGVQTVFTLTNAPTSENYTLININGVSQLHSAYTVANANVTLSTAPVNGAAIEVMTFNLGSGSSGSTYVEVTNNTSANVNTKYIVNTDSANLTITLPSSPALGDEVGIIDGTGNASVHAITIGRNGGNIQGAASNMTVTTDRSAFTLVYYNVTQGWILTNV